MTERGPGSDAGSVGNTVSGARVIDVLRGLDKDRTALKKEKEALVAERHRWAPPVPSPRGGLRPGSAGGGGATAAAAAAVLAATASKVPLTKLPQKCAEKLADVAANELRCIEAQRRVAKAEREAQQLVRQRGEAEVLAEEAVQAAKARQNAAEQKLADMKVAMREAGVFHRQKEAELDTQHAADLQRIEAQIETERVAAEAQNRAIRRRVAEQKTRSKSEIDALLAEHDLKKSQLDKELVEHNDACAAAVAAADERCKEAERSSRQVWAVSRKTMLDVHADADKNVEQAKGDQGDAVSAANKQLADMELALAEEIRLIEASEKELRADHSAENRCKDIQIEIANEIRDRRLARDAALQKNGDEMARLLAAAGVWGTGAVDRARSAQDAADYEIERLQDRMLRIAETDHKGKLVQLHAKLQQSIADSHAQLTDRLDAVSSEVQQLGKEADRALVAADRKVNASRSEQQAHKDQMAQELDQTLNETISDRDRLEAEAGRKVLQTQEKMIQYMASVETDTLEHLQAKASAQLSLRLPVDILATSPASPPLALRDLGV